jgi:hypothetical protein
VKEEEAIEYINKRERKKTYFLGEIMKSCTMKVNIECCENG